VKEPGCALTGASARAACTLATFAEVRRQLFKYLFCGLPSACTHSLVLHLYDHFFVFADIPAHLRKCFFLLLEVAHRMKGSKQE